MKNSIVTSARMGEEDEDRYVIEFDSGGKLRHPHLEIVNLDTDHHWSRVREIF